MAAGCGGGGGGARTGLELDAREFRFQPTRLTVGVGRQATLLVANKGTVAHNLSIPAAGVDADFEPGATNTVIFVAPTSAGTVEFFCKFHRDKGMTGTLLVQP